MKTLAQENYDIKESKILNSIKATRKYAKDTKLNLIMISFTVAFIATYIIIIKGK